MANAADVEMHEWRSGGGVEADAAALQAQSGEANLFERHAGDEEIHRVALHVLAEARDPGGAAAEHGVGGGRAVGGNDLDRLFAVDVAIDFPDDVEQTAIHRCGVLAAPVAKEVIEFLQRGFVVAAVAFEGDSEVFVGMGVVEGEGAGVAVGGRIMDGAGIGHDQKQ